MAERTLNDVVNELKDIKDIVNATKSAVSSSQRVSLDLVSSFKALKLSSKLKGITTGLRGLKSGLTTSLTSIKDDLVLRSMMLGDGIKKSLTDMKEGLSLKLMFLGDSIKQGVKDFGNSIVGKIVAPFKAIGEKFSALKEAVTKPFATIGSALKGVGNFFGNIGKGFLGLFKKKKDPNANNFKLIEAGNKILKDISQGFKDFTEQMKVNANRAKESQREQLELFQSLKVGGGGIGGGGGEGGGEVPGAGGGGGIFATIGRTIGGVIGGIVSGIGEGFAKMGKKFGDIMKGVVVLAALGVALIPAAKAFQMFSDVSWKGVAAGIVVLGSLVLAVAGIGAIMSSGVGTVAILAGAAALAILGVALIPAAKAFEIFSNAVGPIGDFLVNVMGGVAMVFERVAGAIGGVISGIVDDVKRLGELDGANLLVVAAGIAALGGALAAFGVGGAVGGIIGSIGEGFAKLLGGGESPMDRIFKLAEIGSKLTVTVAAIGAFGEAMKNLASNQVPDNINTFLKDFYKIIDKGDFKKRVLDSIGVFTKVVNDMDMAKLLRLEQTMEVVERAMLAIQGTNAEALNDILNVDGAKLEALMVAQANAQSAGNAGSPTIINNVTNNNSNVSNANSTSFTNIQHVDEDLTPIY